MNRNWKIVAIIALVVVASLAISLGVVASKPGDLIAVGRVYQDSVYCGMQGALDGCDYPISGCDVILRYAGAEGTAEIAGQTTHWSVYISNGLIINQVHVGEDGVYSFPLDWRPEGVYTGYEDQEVITVLFWVEVLLPPGLQSQVKAIPNGQIRVDINAGAKVILAPNFLITG